MHAMAEETGIAVASFERRLVEVAGSVAAGAGRIVAG